MTPEELLQLIEQAAKDKRTHLDLSDQKLTHLPPEIGNLTKLQELSITGNAFGKQFKRADRSGAIACLVLGDEEAVNKTVQLKWLKTGEQSAISQAELLANVEELKSRLQTAK